MAGDSNFSKLNQAVTAAVFKDRYATDSNFKKVADDRASNDPVYAETIRNRLATPTFSPSQLAKFTGTNQGLIDKSYETTNNSFDTYMESKGYSPTIGGVGTVKNGSDSLQSNGRTSSEISSNPPAGPSPAFGAGPDDLAISEEELARRRTLSSEEHALLIQEEWEANSVGEERTVLEEELPDDLENYTLDDDGNIVPLNPDDPLGGFGSINPNQSPVTALANVGLIEDKIAPEDWRVRLSLPLGSKKFYNDIANAGILTPLIDTNGVIFPYTPTINLQHGAKYENYDLVHSNYRGYFYRGSFVGDITVAATFTAQDTAEANYLLASIHFLKSCTKMFYGQDFDRGMPPPVLMLNGLGEFQFNDHPCVVGTFNYTLPNDVDYIAAGIPDENSGTEQFFESVKPNTGHNSWSSKISRMIGAQLEPGAERGNTKTQQSQVNSNTSDNIAVFKYKGKTYVPTKIDLNFTLIPIQTRKQVSKEFSLTDYAQGKLLKKGFW